MKMTKILFPIFIGLLLTCCSKSPNLKNESDWPAVGYGYLSENFKSPDALYGVDCWWWWLNGNVTKEAITKDLEAMKSRNFFGAMIFDAGGHDQGGHKDIIPAGPLFGSKEWNDLFVFALDEAKRLGLEIGFNIQSGWNLGGPRVTVEHAAKQLTFSETKITGGNGVNISLKTPHKNYDFYKDLAVLAFPLKEENILQERITFLSYKLGLHELGGSAPDCRFLLDNNRPDRNSAGTAYVLKRSEIVDITGNMDTDGNLAWQAPAGEWGIMRIGYTCTLAGVSTSSEGWKGKVLDYMSKEAFDFYWNDVVKPVLQAAGDHAGTTLKYMETDSWECGGMNWTGNFPNEFKSFCGYDLLKYLPVIGGYVVEDIGTSNAFLADFRKTIAELVAVNHYGEFANCAHKYNMGIQPESAGPHAGPLDGIKNYGYSDIVMSEFWSPSPHRPAPGNRFFLKQASSAAHIYGKRIVGAESFTTIGPHWNDELWRNQKSSFDHEICAGLNRMYFHTFTSSPGEMGLPGQEYFAGTHVNPQVTWWNESGPFIDYIRRTQTVVQNGTFVGDVLYYYGDHVPNVFPFKHSDPAGVMPGFDYDVTSEDILLKLQVEKGKIYVPGGIRYEVLVLPDHRVLSLRALEKVETLLKDGACITGYKPERCISLSGGEKAQSRFHELADKIWGPASEKGENKYGKGLVTWGISAREYLLNKGIGADFQIAGNSDVDTYDYIHYVVAEKDVYFVSNQTGERVDMNCTFRISGFRPELWDALSGEIRIAGAFTQKEGTTTVPLTLEPYGAVFVVFNEPVSKDLQGTAQGNYPDYVAVKDINGPWVVNFDPAWGGPQSVEFAGLTDWTQHPDQGIKYYSGAAVYHSTFTIDFTPEKGKSYVLQLENVKDVGIAAVTINGKYRGVAWTKPFRVDITGDLKSGDNTLGIKVVNSWYNRVLGDEIGIGEKRFTSTNIVLRKTTPEPSGLIGPVRIMEEKWN
ncbi:MAG: glycoside hydrolase [Bacteroidales bacterium]|jgi:hypothetical protein|nr:glycoside hydrolase [Bacteroidales bacterium]